jgi:hypothetical protein
MGAGPLDEPEYLRWRDEAQAAMTAARRQAEAGPYNWVLERRRQEQGRLIRLARAYVDGLSLRVDLVAAAVVGSVARGDFNVWSDIDVLVVARSLPERLPDRAALLAEGAAPGIQPVGFTPAEFSTALAKRNRIAVEAIDAGVVLLGEESLRETAASDAVHSSSSSLNPRRKT